MLAAQHSFYSAFESFVNQCAVGEVAFSLFGFLGKNVAVVGVVSFHFACAGECESLLDCGFCFDFWHF